MTKAPNRIINTETRFRLQPALMTEPNFAFLKNPRQLLQLLRKHPAATLEFDVLEVAFGIQHAIGQRPLIGERFEHALLDCIFRNKINDRDRTRLMLAPGPRDPLFELGWIPGQIAVDYHARVS